MVHGHGHGHEGWQGQEGMHPRLIRSRPSPTQPPTAAIFAASCWATSRARWSASCESANWLLGNTGIGAAGARAGAGAVSGLGSRGGSGVYIESALPCVKLGTWPWGAEAGVNVAARPAPIPACPWPWPAGTNPAGARLGGAASHFGRFVGCILF